MTSRPQSENLTRIYFWVEWKPVSPNELLHTHWTVSTRNAKRARAACDWLNALQHAGMMLKERMERK
jgi:hypothetical protein